MAAPIDNQPFEQLVHRMDSQNKLLRTWTLEGGVSARVTGLEVEQADGQPKKMFVRQHGAADLRQNPHIASHEFKLLHYLKSAGLAVPTPYFVDESGEIFPTPYIVMEFVEGQPEFTPTNQHDFILQLATHLSSIHSLDGSIPDLAFLLQQTNIYARKLSQRPTKLDESIDEGHIRDTLESLWPLPQRNKSVLLHGDFWPGNILWQHGQLVAVIDWEDALLGDPLGDLAITRLDILWALGIDAMYHFTQRYQSLTSIDVTNLPFWDLCAALRPANKISEWAADDIAEKRMRERHRLFVTQAFEKLAVE